MVSRNALMVRDGVKVGHNGPMVAYASCLSPAQYARDDFLYDFRWGEVKVFRIFQISWEFLPTELSAWPRVNARSFDFSSFFLQIGAARL